MKILVPVDGSKNSMDAVNVAMDMAKAKGADISLITVTPFIPGVDLELSANAMDAVNQSMKSRGEDTLRKAQEILASGGIKANAILASSISASDEIISVAEKEKADLIVIGSRGLGGAATRFFMGSVALKVASHAPCSVHIVRM
jgi:nucleotide-binding universal stress UspA family protein